MIIEVYSLFSGSEGNCTLVKTKKSNILIDVGLSMKKIEESLNENIGISLSDINLILMSHSHSDHVKSLYTIYKKYPHIKIGLDNALYLEIMAYYEKEKEQGRLKTFDGLDLNRLIFIDGTLQGNTLTLENHPLKHDAYCIGWSIKEHNGDSLLFIADNGMDAYKFYNEEYIKFPYTYYMIESNYDTTMQVLDKERNTLLKRRVLGGWGHTSNEEAIKKAIMFLERSENTKCKGVMFHHLSEHCNSVELAREFHSEWIETFGKKTLFKGVQIEYALQDKCVKLGEVF